MYNYILREYKRKSYSNVTVQFLLAELEDISEQASKYGIFRHTLPTRAIKLGLPQALANLEAKAARARPTVQDQVKE